MRNIPVVTFVIGVAILYIGSLNVASFFRATSAINRRVLWVGLGIASAVALFALAEYLPSADERYFGLPFFSFAFVRKNGVWRDYLGPLTLPALIANAYVGFTLPFIGLGAWRRIRKARSASAV